MEIREVIDDGIDVLKDNKELVIFGCLGVAIILLLSNRSNSTLVTPSGYVSYPDTVTNADSITSNVNDTTLAISDSIMDYLNAMNSSFGASLSSINNSLIGANNNLTDLSHGIEKVEATATKNQQVLSDLKQNNSNTVSISKNNTYSSVEVKATSINQKNSTLVNSIKPDLTKSTNTLQTKSKE